jgi:hypothetical protein
VFSPGEPQGGAQPEKRSILRPLITSKDESFNEKSFKILRHLRRRILMVGKKSFIFAAP